MGEETRKLLRVFGVTVTKFEEETENLERRLAQVGTKENPKEALVLLHEVAESIMHVNDQWLAITNHLFHEQRALLERIIGQISVQEGKLSE